MAAKKGFQPVALDFLTTEQPRTTTGLFAAGMNKEELQQAVPLELDRLQDNPYQPRLGMDEAALKELALVIKTQGFQGVLVARPDPDQRGSYQLTAGHRRREAARQAGLKVLPVVVKSLDEKQMAAIAITENIQREDLTPLEEGKIFLLMSDQMGYTQEEIAETIGKHRGYVVNRLRVARAPLDIQELVRAKPDSLRAVSSLIKVEDEKERVRIEELLLENKLTADELPGYVATQERRVKPEAPGQGRWTLTHNGRSLEIDPDEAEQAGTSPENGYSPPGSLTGELDPAADRARNLARLGSGKLALALRTLRSYKQSLSRRETLSRAEIESLEAIAALVEELQSRASPAPD